MSDKASWNIAKAPKNMATVFWMLITKFYTPNFTPLGKKLAVKYSKHFKLWSINSPGYYVYKRLTASQADVLWSPVFWHQDVGKAVASRLWMEAWETRCQQHNHDNQKSKNQTRRNASERLKQNSKLQNVYVYVFNYQLCFLI